MGIIELTRQLGAELQKEEAYKKFKEILDINEKDEELKALIGEFNLLRVSFDNESGKEDKNEQKLAEIDNKLRECYTKIMDNEGMKAFNEAKHELDHIMSKITGILTLCIEGEDPMTCQVPEDKCGSGCGGCSGC